MADYGRQLLNSVTKIGDPAKHTEAKHMRVDRWRLVVSVLAAAFVFGFFRSYLNPQDRQPAGAVGGSTNSYDVGAEVQGRGAVRVAESDLPLDRAARAGNLDELRRLLDQGADPNELNKWGTTALTGAPAHTEIVRHLIAHGADVNKRVADGTTPLNEASFWGHSETVAVLLEARANVNEAKENGYTPLISAASQGHLAIVRQLIEAGADLNRQTQGGLTALHLASSNGHREVVELLLAAGARPDVTNSRGETFKDVADRTKGLTVR